MEEKVNITIVNGNLPMGTILPFYLPFQKVPAGWLLCDGSAIPAKYQALISALGSNNTPNLAGRTLIGTGIPNNNKQSDGTTPNFTPAANWPLGYTGGELVHTLSEAEMPAHSHSYSYINPTGVHAGNFYSGDYWEPTTIYANTQNAGGGQAHNNMAPYVAVNYIIFTGENAAISDMGTSTHL